MKNITKIILALLLFMHCSETKSQSTFQLLFGQPPYPIAGYDLVKTYDGGYMIGGNGHKAFMNNKPGILLLKVNSNGLFQFAKIWSRYDVFEWVTSIRQTPDSGFIMFGVNDTLDNSGPVPQRGPHTAFLGKADQQGQLQWIKEFPAVLSHVEPGDIEIASDGNFVMITDVVDHSINRFILNLIKTNTSGDTIWTKCYRPAVSSLSLGLKNMKQTTDGGFLISGSTFLNSPTRPILIKVNSTGNLEWYKRFDSDKQFGYMEATNDSGFILCGTNYRATDSATIFIAKGDKLGNITWSKIYFSSRPVNASKIKQTADNGYLLSGYWQDTTAENSDVLLMKLDNSGNVIWSKRYGGLSADGGSCIIEDNGSYVVSGGYSESASIHYLYLLKTDSNGFSGCNEDTLSISSTPLSWLVDTFTVYENYFPLSQKTIHLTSESMPYYQVLCTTSGIPENEIENNFELFPNPSTGDISIKSDSYKNINVQILDLFGRTMIELRNYFGNSIDVLKYPSGIYIVRITINNNRQVIKYFIKN